MQKWIFLTLLLPLLVIPVYAQENTESSIPSWIKSIATAWGNDQLTDAEFTDALEFLIESKVISLPSYQKISPVNSELIEFEEVEKEYNLDLPLPEISTYEINSVCELGTTYEEIMMGKIMPIVFQLPSGMYNDNENLIEHVSTFNVNGLTFTIDELFPILPPLPENYTGLARNYDPMYFDVVFMTPFALAVMDASPEVSEILTYHAEEDTETSYVMRVQDAISKCQ